MNPITISKNITIVTLIYLMNNSKKITTKQLKIQYHYWDNNDITKNIHFFIKHMYDKK